MQKKIISRARYEGIKGNIVAKQKYEKGALS